MVLDEVLVYCLIIFKNKKRDGHSLCGGLERKKDIRHYLVLIRMLVCF